MADIIEIIHDLQYRVQGTVSLDQALTGIKQQVAVIDNLQTSLARLKAAYANAANPQQQQQLAASITHTQQAIDRQTQSLQASIAANRTLSDAMAREMSVIGQLTTRLNELKEARAKSQDKEEITNLTSQIADAQKELSGLTSESSKLGGLSKIYDVAKQVFPELDYITLLRDAFEGLMDLFSKGDDTVVMDNYTAALKKATDESASQVASLYTLQSALHDNSLSRTEQLEQLEKAKDAFPEYIGALNEEDIGTRKVSAAIENQIELIKHRDSVKAAQSTVTEAVKKQAEAEAALNKELANNHGWRFDMHIGSMDDVKKATGELTKAQELLDDAEHGNVKQRKEQIAVVDGVISKYKELAQTYENDKKYSAGENYDLNNSISLLKTNITFLEAYRKQLEKTFQPVSVKSDPLQSLLNYDTADILNAAKGSKEERDAKQAEAHDKAEKARRDLLDEYTIKKHFPKDQLLANDDYHSALTLINAEEEHSNKEAEEAYNQAQKNKEQTTATATVAREQKQKAANNRAVELTKRLQEQLTSIQEQGQDAELARLSESNYKIEAIQNAKRDHELTRLKTEQELNRKAGVKTDETEELYGELRTAINEKYNQQLLIQESDLAKKRQQQQEADHIASMQANLDILKGENGLPGGATLGSRVAQADAETNLEVAKIHQKYGRLIDELNIFNDDFFDRYNELNAEEQQQVSLTIEQGSRKRIDAHEAEFTAVKKQLDDSLSYQVAAISAEAGDEERALGEKYEKHKISYREYLRQLKVIQAEAAVKDTKAKIGEKQGELDEAIDTAGDMEFDPDATKEDINKAYARVDGIKGELGKLDVQLKGNEKEAGDARKQGILDTIKDYEVLTDAIAGALNNIYAAQQQSLDREISIRHERVTAAEKLAERGNVQALKQEEDRLAKAEQMRETYARRQQALNAAVTLSNSIAAISEAAITGDIFAPATIAAMVAALAAGYVAVQSLTASTVSSTGFARGVINLQGPGTATSDSIPARLSKGESVMTAAETARHRDALEAIRAGSFHQHFARMGQVAPRHYRHAALNNSAFQYSDGAFAAKADLKKLEQKMDAVVTAIYDTQVSVNTKIDRRGISQSVTEMQAQERRRRG